MDVMMKSVFVSLALILFITTSSVVHGDVTDSAFYNSNGGEFMAILASGDVDDFGYNYIINAGRVNMEYQLNMSSTLFLPNIFDNTSCISVSIGLVQKNFRLVISTSYAHGNCMSELAVKFPNVSFVQYGVKSTLPNLSYLSFSNSEFWWAVGVFAGATSTTDKVGFVHPGTASSLSSINAFYSGVKYANASLSVYTMYTGAFIAVDRAKGACDVLINEIGVGALTGHQDDLTVPIAAKTAGLLAIGVTGYSLRQLYGELVGTSFLRDWAKPLVIISPAVTGTIYKGDVLRNFKNEGQYLDQKSHLVTDAQWEIVTNAIALLKQGKTPFYCGSYMADLGGLNTTTNCMLNTSLFLSQVAKDVHTLGFYDVPLNDQAFSKGTRAGIIATASVLLVLPVVCAILVFLLRNNLEIKAGSPFFFMVMIIGCVLVYVGVIIWPLDPSESVCRARIWLPSIGATIALSALFTKNIRIYLLYFNPFKFRADNLSIKNFFPIVIGMVVLDSIILAVYSGVGPKGVRVEQGIKGLGTYDTRHVCATSDDGNAIIYTILAFHMFQCIAGCVISFLLRNVTNREFDERKAVGMAIYVVTFCLVIVSVLLGVTDISNEQLVLFVSLALLICNTAVLLIIFGSRFVDVVAAPEPQSHLPKNASSRTGGNTGGTHSGGRSTRSQNSMSHSQSDDAEQQGALSMKEVVVTTNV